MILLIIIVILFIFPGIYAYVAGRYFLVMEKNKVFAQQYFRYQQQAGLCFWICFILSSFVLSYAVHDIIWIEWLWHSAWWLVYLIYFVLAYSMFIAGISTIQRAVRNERIPLLPRIKFNIIQLYLILWPYVFLWLAAFGKMKNTVMWSVLICILYALMYAFYFDIWKALMSATIVGASGLKTHFDEISKTAGLSMIPMLLFPAAGLKFANAFFVGNYGVKKGVFISRFAYDNLTPDEVTAIYAHEIGHAQKHQVLRRSIALVIPFVLIVAFNMVLPGLHVIYRLIALIAGLIIMKLLIPSQKFEKEADLFAVKAMDDAEVVISSIEKIYQLGILPERFAPSDEKRLSHPSLVRRKAYMRDAVGKARPELKEAIVFQGIDPDTKINFSSEEFIVSRQKDKSTAYRYDEVISMFPQAKKEFIELTITFTSTKQKLKLNAKYEDITEIIDSVMHKFSSKPYVDAGKFKRAYYISASICTLFGLIFSFFIGPALMILGIIGLAKCRKNMFLSFLVANLLYFLYPYIVRHDSSNWMMGKAGIIFIVIAFIVLIDYLLYRKFDESRSGNGLISLGFGIFMTLVALCVIVALFINQAWQNNQREFYDLYRALFFNSLVLSTGILVSYRMRDIKRIIVMICNVILFLFFILLHLS